MNADNTLPNLTQSKEEKLLKCTGCGTVLTKLDKNCPNCERLNPNYIYR